MPKKPKFQTLTGMRDILPEEQKYFNKVYKTIEKIVKFYGFQKIDTPILEKAELFEKGTGLTTDIVEKEMYILKRGKETLALRPEFTPSIVRAYIEHGMFNQPQPLKLYALGPVFRAETPQAGRYRQFHQFDLEVFGEQSPVIDAQVIQIFYNVLKNLKINKPIIEINTLGDNQCRPYYKKLLNNFLKRYQSSLCAYCRSRARTNPLRTLDCKEEKCQRIANQAPQLIDHLCQDCHKHFKEVLEFLDEIELPYQLNPYLVRGLDYYTKTVFEFFKEPSSQVSEKKQGKEDEQASPRRLSLVAGGRFDKLVKQLGGKDTPVCGAAMGIERIINVLKEKSITFPPKKPPKIFLTQLGSLPKRKSLSIIENFRKASITIAESLGRNSLKAQIHRADKLGARYTLILGQKEALDGNIIIRDMKTGKQKTARLENVVEEVRKRLRKS